MFLQNHLWTEDNIDHDFKGVTAAATLFLNEASRNNNVFQKFIEPISEVCLSFIDNGAFDVDIHRNPGGYHSAFVRGISCFLSRCKKKRRIGSQRYWLTSMDSAICLQT
jgi:hypothetical protein